MTDSTEAIQRILTKHETELTEKKNELQARADKEKEEIINEQSTKANEKDTIKKNTLEALNKLQVKNLLNQNQLEVIFRYANNHPDILDKIGANTLFNLEN
jgi:DNA integrity scanning protein DisA with diadenylate cyclase activity